MSSNVKSSRCRRPKKHRYRKRIRSTAQNDNDSHLQRTRPVLQHANTIDIVKSRNSSISDDDIPSTQHAHGGRSRSLSEVKDTFLTFDSEFIATSSPEQRAPPSLPINQRKTKMTESIKWDQRKKKSNFKRYNPLQLSSSRSSTVFASKSSACSEDEVASPSPSYSGLMQQIDRLKLENDLLRRRDRLSANVSALNAVITRLVIQETTEKKAVEGELNLFDNHLMKVAVGMNAKIECIREWIDEGLALCADSARSRPSTEIDGFSECNIDGIGEIAVSKTAKWMHSITNNLSIPSSTRSSMQSLSHSLLSIDEHSERFSKSRTSGIFGSSISSYAVPEEEEGDESFYNNKQDEEKEVDIRCDEDIALDLHRRMKAKSVESPCQNNQRLSSSFALHWIQLNEKEKARNKSNEST